MAKPLVSVVVVSYNQAQYITTILDSVKAQTYTNWELIVADDASPDDSAAIFKKWLAENDLPAKEIYHVKNTGFATVLNEALKCCSGTYVKFIAADDYLHPECLEKSVLCLQEMGEKYAMVFTDTFCVGENGESLPDFADFNSIMNTAPEDLHEVLIKGNRIAALTVMMRTEVVRETGEYNARFLVEDYQRWLLISQKYFIAYLPEKLAYYRLHPGNVSKSKADRIVMEDRMLQIMFDRTGVARNDVNDYLHRLYVWNKPISDDFWELYRIYPFSSKTLKYCVQYKIPPLVYKILFSLSLRTKIPLP